MSNAFPVLLRILWLMDWHTRMLAVTFNKCTQTSNLATTCWINLHAWLMDITGYHECTYTAAGLGEVTSVLDSSISPFSGDLWRCVADIPFRHASLEVWVHLSEVTANILVCQSMSHKILNNFGNGFYCSLSRFSMHIPEVAMEISTLVITSFGGFLSLDLH